MTGTPVAKRLWRGGKRLLLGLVVLLLAYQLWLFGWVLWWGQVNPEHTRFMDIRLAELRSKDPAAQLKKQWVDYAQISPNLKRAVVAAEDDLFVQHDGFDWEGIQRAMEKNQRRGRIVAGLGATAVIPSNRTRKIIIPHDATAYKQRNRIERCFCRLKHFRRLATRYDRRTAHFAGFIHLAATMIWMK